MGTLEAGRYLHELLSEPGSARRRWQRHQLGAVGADEVSITAVCRVIAQYLWDSGEYSDTDADLPRRLKDRVARALHGSFLNPVTLRWFAGAFDLAESDALRLQLLLDGSPATRVVIGRATQAGLPPAGPYRTLSLYEDHYLGPDGLPARHLTTQVIEATADGLRAHRYMFDTATLAVDVRQGGRLAEATYDLGNGLFACDVVLMRPLRKGETTTLRYSSAFHYTEPPPPEFHRAALRLVQNVNLRVEFHPGRLPRQVYFAEWHDLRGRPMRRTPVACEPDNSVARLSAFHGAGHRRIHLGLVKGEGQGRAPAEAGGAPATPRCLRGGRRGSSRDGPGEAGWSRLLSVRWRTAPTPSIQPAPRSRTAV
jgi:hypothetical protein